jgi:hypothetical protein
MGNRYAKAGKSPGKNARELEEDGEDSDVEVDDDTDPRHPRTKNGVAHDAELVEISSWPGTADAAKIAQVHPSTIKSWRGSGRLKAQMDLSGNWRHDPDSLAELIGQPETTDPATLLATGMTSIVQQGERAGERLLAMTEITNSSLERVVTLMGSELDRAYARIAALEKERGEILDRADRAMEASFKHERWLKRIQNEHELTMTDKRDGSSRLQGLLEILGPIGASIAARVVGDERAAMTAETKAISASGSVGIPAMPTQPNDTIETRITRELGNLMSAVRALEDSEYKAFRLMLPDDVGVALDIVKNEADGSKIGASLAYVCKVACSLPREKFDALAPIAPRGVAVVLGKLRELINEEKPS